jgi:hypothetical protein
MAASLYRSYLVWLVSASFHTGLIRHRIAHTPHLFVARIRLIRSFAYTITRPDARLTSEFSLKIKLKLLK